MRMNSNVMFLTCAASIIWTRSFAADVGCSSSKEILDELRLVKIEAESRAGLELMSSVSNCLRGRSETGTIGDIDDSAIDQLIELLDSDDDGIRSGAALSLGWFGPKAKRAEPSLDRAYIRIEKELSKRFVLPTSASDVAIVAALERITGKSADQLQLPPITNDGK